jgi:hypothetical protein
MESDDTPASGTRLPVCDTLGVYPEEIIDRASIMDVESTSVQETDFLFGEAAEPLQRGLP